MQDLNKIAQEINHMIRSASQQSNHVLLLTGQMGAGKTTFTRAFAAELGIHENITSPTFVGLHHYQTESLNFLHYDAYQVEIDCEFLSDIFNEAKTSISVIEWSEKLSPETKKFLQSSAQIISLDIKVNADDSRQFTIE